MILVTGATGNVGSELVRALAATGEPVRALVRRGGPPGGEPLPGEAFPPGVEPFAGDLSRPDSIRDAAAGARGMFLLPGYQGISETLTAVRAAGVGRVVLLSGNPAARCRRRRAGRGGHGSPRTRRACGSR
jgi:uncharacterized protein YbjT (DUF2867 family)